MSDEQTQYEEYAHGPWTGIHRHKVTGGWMKHTHPIGNPDYPDRFKEPHSHIIVLHERNYVNEYSGPALEEA